MMEPAADQLQGLKNTEKMSAIDWIIDLNEEMYRTFPACFLPGPNIESKRIHRLPESVTDRNKEAYKPLVVSLGPYHNGEVKLKATESHKLQALQKLFLFSSNSLQAVGEAVNEIVTELRDMYDDLDDEWKRDTSKFSRMMTLDGCFIIEILMNYSNKIIYEYDDDYELLKRIFRGLETSEKKRFREQKHMATLVRRDMLLIENQVPLLLLRKILCAGGRHVYADLLMELILNFLFPHKSFMKYGEFRHIFEDGKCLHILDVYRKCLISKISHPTRTRSSNSVPSFYEGIARFNAVGKFLKSKFNMRNKANKEKYHIRHYSATEIKEVGIKLKSISKKDQGISFDGTTLWLPNLFLNDASKSSFLNVMAFERFHENAGNEFTTYILFKNELIKNVSDVRFLKEEKIIYNSMGSDEEVIQLFHQLSREIYLDPKTSLSDQWHVNISDKLNSYYSSHKSTLRKWKYNLTRTYFKSPWTLMSVLAATSILCLTATQTAYTILSYVNRETSP